VAQSPVLRAFQNHWHSARRSLSRLAGWRARRTGSFIRSPLHSLLQVAHYSVISRFSFPEFFCIISRRVIGCFLELAPLLLCGRIDLIDFSCVEAWVGGCYSYAISMRRNRYIHIFLTFITAISAFTIFTIKQILNRIQGTAHIKIAALVHLVLNPCIDLTINPRTDLTVLLSKRGVT
jgi:hypothetical protein